MSVTARRVARLAAMFVIALSARARGQTPVLDDTAILSLLGRLGSVEVECTTYAADHATLPTTKLFAEKLRNDHAAFLEDGARLAERLGITIEPKIESAVADSHAAILADMHVMSGMNFDRVFVDHEIGFLQYAMNFVRDVMYPAATSPLVKQFLIVARPLLADHLKLAREAKEHVRKGT